MPYVIRTKPERIELDDGVWVEMRPHITAGEYSQLIAEVDEGKFRNTVYELTLRTMQLLVTDWGGFVDEGGEPIPYTAEALAAINPQSVLYKKLTVATNERMGDTDPKGPPNTSLPSQDVPRE